MMKKLIIGFLTVFVYHSAPAGSCMVHILEAQPASSIQAASEFMARLTAQFQSLKDTPWEEAEKPYQDMLQVFAQTATQNDSASEEFRSKLTHQTWKPSDGTMWQNQVEVNNRLKLYGRVIGQKDGAFIVIVPAVGVKWTEASQAYVEIFTVVPVKIVPKDKSAESLVKALSVDLDLSPAKQILESVKRAVHKAVYKNDNYIPLRQELIFLYDGTSAYYTEKLLTLYRDSFLVYPTLAQLHSTLDQ